MIKDINFEIVGNLLIQLRERAGISQQDFAKEIGVSKGAVCQWEQGSGIKTENLYDIARYFNISVSELIEGQLQEDDENDYFARNYDLDDFEYFEEINSDNYFLLLQYLKRCKNVIKRFMFLFQIKLDDNLTKKQEIEYRKLSRYFVIDQQYLNENDLGFISDIDGIAQDFVEFHEIEDKKELDYILYRAVSLRIKINSSSLLMYEKDDAALNDYFDIIGQERRDALLTKIVSNTKEEEIENSLPIKRLIEAGARCFVTRDRIGSFEYNEINNDIFKQLDKVVRNKNIQERYEFFESKKKKNIFYDEYNPYNWKNFALSDYCLLIDEERTNFFRNILLLKEDNPKTYYAKLKERDNLYSQE